MRTSEVAAQAQVNTQTLRYYERRGLLPAPARTRSGYRAYTPDAVRVVRFVKRAQQLGFTLDDIEDLLHLAQGGPASCDEPQTMARTRIDDLQERIDELASMRDALARGLVDTCEQHRAERECPNLRTIEPVPPQQCSPPRRDFYGRSNCSPRRDAAMPRPPERSSPTA